ncbi:hypothetical protein R6Q57_024781 [Mikania cordata]
MFALYATADDHRLHRSFDPRLLIPDMSSSDEMEVPVDDLEVDQFDELMDHPWLQFPHGTVARNRRDRLLRKEMCQQKAMDYDLLAELGQLERMTAIIGEDTSWSRLFEMTYAPQYRLITVEFLSTFVYMPHGPDFQPQAGPQQSKISFRLCGAPYQLSLAEFGSVLGLYTEEETQMPIYTTAIHTADDAVVSAWWPQIGDEPFVRAARVTRIRDPLIRIFLMRRNSSFRGRHISAAAAADPAAAAAADPAAARAQSAARSVRGSYLAARSSHSTSTSRCFL